MKASFKFLALLVAYVVIMPFKVSSQESGRALDTTLLHLEDITKTYGILMERIKANVSIDLSQKISEVTRATDKAQAQKELRDLNSRLIKSVSDVTFFQKDLTTVRKEISLIYDGIITQKIVSPTSSYLGQSFSNLVKDNAQNILTAGLSNNKRSTFSKIVSLVVNNPLVTSLTNSNPITSMARDVVSQAISFTEGKIDTSVLTRFNSSLAPSLEFYGSIDAAVNELEKSLLAVQVSIDRKNSKYERTEKSIQELLSNYPGDKKVDKIKSMLKIDSINSLSSIEITTILNSDDVRKTIQLLDKQLTVADDFIDDPESLNTAYGNYKKKMVEILTKAKQTPSLKLDGTSVDLAISFFRK